MNTALTITLESDRQLRVRLPGPHRVASWAIAGGGLREADQVLWRYVRREELPHEVDPVRLLEEHLARADAPNAVGLLTARTLEHYALGAAEVDGVSAEAIVTAGLSNARRVGDLEEGMAPRVGTINALVRVSVPLTDEALLEALALATEAKCLAMLEARVPSPRSGLDATGTGTDCLVIASPLAASREPYAGKHTAVGAAIGRASLAGMRDAFEGWKREQPPR